MSAVDMVHKPTGSRIPANNMIRGHEPDFELAPGIPKVDDSEIAQRLLMGEIGVDQARKEFIKFVTISVGSDFKEIDYLTSQLKELSTNGSGSPIVISYSGNNAKADIQLPKELTIEVSDLSYRTLESICGKGNVDLVYYARPYIH